MKKLYFFHLIDIVAMSILIVALNDKFDWLFCLKVILPLAVIIGSHEAALIILQTKIDKLEKGKQDTNSKTV